jgi:hypothetical protein
MKHRKHSRTIIIAQSFVSPSYPVFFLPVCCLRTQFCILIKLPPKKPFNASTLMLVALLDSDVEA